MQNLVVKRDGRRTREISGMVWEGNIKIVDRSGGVAGWDGIGAAATGDIFDFLPSTSFILLSRIHVNSGNRFFFKYLRYRPTWPRGVQEVEAPAFFRG